MKFAEMSIVTLKNDTITTSGQIECECFRVGVTGQDFADEC